MAETRQTIHRRSCVIPKAPHLAIFAFVNCHFKPSLVSFSAQEAHRGGTRGLSFDVDALFP
jgi:hypothetical protein